MVTVKIIITVPLSVTTPAVDHIRSKRHCVRIIDDDATTHPFVKQSGGNFDKTNVA